MMGHYATEVAGIYSHEAEEAHAAHMDYLADRHAIAARLAAIHGDDPDDYSDTEIDEMLAEEAEEAAHHARVAEEEERRSWAEPEEEEARGTLLNSVARLPALVLSNFDAD